MGALKPPCAVEGTDDDKRQAFDKIFRLRVNHIQQFVNLPFDILDEPTIKRELSNIAKANTVEQA